MNTETKIAFRATISEVLLYIVEPGRDKTEILTVMDKLEQTVINLIHVEMLAVMPAVEYKMKAADRIIFRGQIAAVLEVISRPDTLPPKIVGMIKDLEKWIEEIIEENLRVAAAETFGKPKMTITRLKDLPN